ncbi:glycosyltransferase [Candidatus Sumerlaeota bacterium]|nr:glycosyltransferase [Candidatus Sumerlaeota bacterium]
MSKILLIGTGPLLEPGVRFFSGQCMRTLHFMQPLLDMGHEVRLAIHPISDLHFDPKTTAVSEEAQHGALRYLKLNSNTERLIMPALQLAHDAFEPDCVIGVNPFPSHLACRLRTNVPVWCDMNGYAMVEGQTRAHVYQSDDCLPHFHRRELSVLRRADKISVVSRRQYFAVLGELAMAGRLNRHTFDYDFGGCIPNAVNPHFMQFDPNYERPRVNGEFRVLWCGGFNTWTDVDFLYDALTAAMERNPSIRFIATGGVIEGHDEKTFVRFQELVQSSPYADRIELLGWVESEKVDELLLSCQLGVNVDARNYETMFGARNRITTMLACGLPALTTLGAEITEDLREEGVALTVPLGDRAGFTEAILHAAEEPQKLSELARRAREFALEEYECASTIRACLDWTERPQLAPDNAARLELPGDPDASLTLRPLNGVDWILAELERHTMQRLVENTRDLELIRNKPWYRILRSIKRMFRGGNA